MHAYFELFSEYEPKSIAAELTDLRGGVVFQECRSMSQDQEEQEDELLALASIYDEEEFRRAESAQGGEIQICLELPQDFKIVVKGGRF